MSMNKILKKMGFSEGDKVLIVHADDVGITHTSIDAFLELVDFGTVTCGSAMVPCSWFPEVAKRFRENPKLDIGLHLAFNGEYETYRWRPISNVSTESGFTDENGYFKQNAQEVMRTADPKAISKEIEAQIKVALNLGLKPTHVDSHSGTLMASNLIDSFIDIPLKYNILPVLANFDASAIEASEMMMKEMTKDKPHLSDEQKNEIRKSLELDYKNLFTKVDKFREEGIPVVDNIVSIPLNMLNDPNDRLEAAKHMINNLKAGSLTHFAFHPTKDTAETCALNRFCEGRIGDYETFRRKELKEYIKNKGIQLIGYRDIMKYIYR